MKIPLSPRHRGAIFLRLASVNDWGGSEDALMVRAHIWTVLHLKAFEKQAATLDPEKLSAKTQPWELSREMSEHIIASVVSVGANVHLAMTYSEIITALRAAFPKVKLPEAPR